MKVEKRPIGFGKFEMIFFISFFVFSSLIMWKTFGLTPEGNFKIASKVWSDFAAAIPLIRSFSLGDNFPVEHPFFPGEPIHYHFLFYLITGIFERIGFRIDFALNLLSSLSFTFLLLMIYLLSKSFFRNKAVSILSVIFFLFNGTLSFFEFFKLHPLSLKTFSDIASNNTFQSFGPYDGKIVSAFWNLNIYTNQRHLALSFALGLFIIYVLYQKFSHEKNIINITIFTTLSLVLLLFINKAVFTITLLFILWFIILKPRKRFIISVSLIIGILILLLSTTFSKDIKTITFFPGFLIERPLTLQKFFEYWFYNFGLHIFLIPVGFVISSKKQRQIIFPLISLFLLANFFRFSNDMVNNHKFFNFFLIFGSMFTANVLVRLWKAGKGKIFLLGKISFLVLFIFVTLSGVIDLAAIFNDHYYIIPDIPQNKDALFFLNNTSPKSVVLNSRWFYNSASIAGRPIFSGYSYFTWSYGYDAWGREKVLLSIYEAESRTAACRLLLENNISYVELNDRPEDHIHPNWSLWRNDFKPIYQNSESGTTVYEVISSCRSTV